MLKSDWYKTSISFLLKSRIVGWALIEHKSRPVTMVWRESKKGHAYLVAMQPSRVNWARALVSSWNCRFGTSRQRIQNTNRRVPRPSKLGVEAHRSCWLVSDFVALHGQITRREESCDEHANCGARWDGAPQPVGQDRSPFHGENRNKLLCDDTPSIVIDFDSLVAQQLLGVRNADFEHTIMVVGGDPVRVHGFGQR